MFGPPFSPEWQAWHFLNSLAPVSALAETRSVATGGSSAAAAAPPKKKSFGAGSTVRHPKYGRGTVLRREGEGDDAKLTISFPGYGLKKIIEKFAGIREE